MAGSAGIAGLIAHAMFWALMLIGFVSGEFDRRHGVILLLVWAFGRFGLPYVASGDMLFTPYIAIVDVMLVFMIFKGDVRLQ